MRRIKKQFFFYLFIGLSKFPAFGWNAGAGARMCCCKSGMVLRVLDGVYIGARGCRTNMAVHGGDYDESISY